MKGKIILLSALSLALLAGCSDDPKLKKNRPAKPEGDYEVTVDFLKVGKADAMIIKTETHTVIIDCGEESDGEKVCARLRELGVERVDQMILTHYDKDHIGGAPEVIHNFAVENIISPDYIEGSKQFMQLCNAVDLQGVNIDNPVKKYDFTYDDAEFSIYPSKKNIYSDGIDNNQSIIVRMKHHDKVFIFAGDAMEERLAEVMDIGDCDVLKVPYHGRNINNLGEFLDKTTPEYAVVSTDKETLEKKTKNELSNRGIQTFMTYKTGNVRCISDGKDVHFETGKG